MNIRNSLNKSWYSLMLLGLCFGAPTSSAQHKAPARNLEAIQEGKNYGGAFYAHGKRIMLAYDVDSSRGEYEAIELFDTQGGKHLASLRGPYREPDDGEVNHLFLPASAAITLDGKWAFLAGGGLDAFLAFDVLHARLPVWGVECCAVTVSPDSKFALLDRGYKAELWNVTTGMLVRILRQIPLVDGRSYTGGIGPTAFSPHGKHAVTTILYDDTILVSDVRSGKVVRELHCDNVSEVIFSPNGRYLLTLSSRRSSAIPNTDAKPELYVSNQVRLWEWRTGKLVRAFSLPDEENARYYVEFTPEGRHLVVCDGRQISVWNVRTGRQERRFAENHTDSFLQEIRVSPDGKYVLSVKGAVGLWRFATGELIRTF